MDTDGEQKSAPLPVPDGADPLVGSFGMSQTWWRRLIGAAAPTHPAARLGRRRALALAGGGLAAPLAAPFVGSAAHAQSGDPSSDMPPQQPSSQPSRRWPAYFGRKSVWGYVNRHSVLQGDGFDLMLSVGSGQPAVRGRLEFFRFTHEQPAGTRLVWTSQPVVVGYNRVNAAAATLGPNWPAAIAAIDTTDWPPGCYTADFVSDVYGQRDPHVAQIIIRPARPRGQILVKLGTSTYQAYNDWGGYSFYTGGKDETSRGAMLSFDRPSPPGILEYEIFLVRWLEELAARTGIKVDYCSNFDIHNEPALMPAYKLVICGSHDEYWSKEEFDAFEARIFRHGSNTMFLGGNTAYWQVRYTDINRPPGGPDHGRQMVCYKSNTDPIARRVGSVDPTLLVTAMFRDSARRPENMLMGVAYQNWFTPTGNPLTRVPYIVNSTDFPFFADTGLKEGDPVGDVVGYEWDNRDPYNNGARLWDANRSRIGLLPMDSIRVVLRGSPVDTNGRRGRAEAVYFETRAGAKVFNAGSIRWAWGLGKSGFTHPGFQKLNENLIQQFLT